ncbi:MAG: putative transcriptional regulator [Glaciecola sp.]|jgi:putative transcriptional regulator
MIKFHPNNQQLSEFSSGVMSPTESLIVSAHCDMCVQCSRKISLYTESNTNEAFNDSPDAEAEHAFGSMLFDITSQQIDKGIAREPSTKVLELDGRQFTLPSSLNRFAASIGNWSHLVGKIWQAPVNIGGDTVANFIFMEKGGSVPEHTHRGTEMTLVVNGEFSDGLADYDSGDFMVMDEKHVHTPVATSDEGCLVFSIVDKPLHFTSGWARLINPFSHLFFK